MWKLHLYSLRLLKARFKINKEAEHDSIRYFCDQCDHLSKAKRYLNKHKNIKHGSVKYSCEKCDFHARSRGKLTAHKQAKHGGIRLSCNLCEVDTLTNFICI